MLDIKPSASSAEALVSLEVLTLGSFLVKNGPTVLSESCSRSRKVWDLFKYFLANHDQTLLPEAIVEQLWPDQAYADPKCTVRTMVHRLRRLLGDNANLIRFYQGGYILRQQKDFWWDVPVFGSCCQQARQEARAGNEEQAVDLYRQALALYNGDFLPECSYSDWVIPFRNHYQRLYLQSACELLAILKKNGRHAETIEEADKALFIDFFEEEIHLFYLEALLAEGRTAQARSHYQNVTSIFYREMGIKPSAAMKNLFRLIQSTDTADDILDFPSFNETLQSRELANGAFYCEPEFFHFLCRLETRRLERNSQQACLALLSASTPHSRLPASKVLRESMPLLQEELQAGLRKSDLLCRFSDHQFMILLPTARLEQAQQVLQRIEEKFYAADKSDLRLKSRLQLLQADQK